MKYIFTLLLLLLLSSISFAEQTSFVPKPIPKPTSPLVLDEYGKISRKEEKKRLKLVAQEIKDIQKQVNDLSVPIIYYGEKCSALKTANRAKDYLVNTEGIESDKIIMFYGGENEDLIIRIYVLPGKPTEPETDNESSKVSDCNLKPQKPKRRVKRQSRRTTQ